MRLWTAAFDDSDARQISSSFYRESTRLAIERMRERARLEGGPGYPGTRGDLERLLSAVAIDEALANRRQILALGRTLPGDELEVALLSRIDRLTPQEIADLLGVPARTVRRSLRRLEEQQRTRSAGE